MKPFQRVSGPVAVLDRADVDTDQIIPKQFLKRIERTGYGEFLFFDWAKDPTFELNRPEYQGAEILIAGRNFGCGSSREHAAWALEDHGFRAVIAPSFADIFSNNAVTNGLLPAIASDAVVAALAEKAAAIPGYALDIDLHDRRLRDSAGLDEPFEVDDTARYRLLNGLDDISLILQHETAIARYEARLTTP